MNNNVGYQLIEPSSLSSLNLLGISYEVAMLHWIVSKLRMNFSEKDYAVKIDVIVAAYQDSYPCIGVHYFDTSTPDIEPQVENTISNIINKELIADFLTFISENQLLINETLKKL